MISRVRTLAGALALCALSICAFAAASASASELTAVTCKDEGVESNLNSHCETGTSGTYKTVALPLNTKTEVEGTTTGEEGPMLRTVLGGLNVTIKCETAHLKEAWVENKETSAGKHEVIGGGRLTYTGCHALLKSKESRYCAVEEVTGPSPGTKGMISTNMLKGETTGVEHKVKIQPAEGEVFAAFNVMKQGSAPGEENECFYVSQCNVEMAGSVEGEVNTTNHSHLTFTEANNGNELKNASAIAKYIDTIGGNMAGEPETTVGATTFT